MKNIVVAFELDYTSRNAAKYAAEIARLSGMGLSLHHTSFAGPAAADFPDNFAAMESYTAKLRRKYRMDRIKSVTIPGKPLESIKEYESDGETAMIIAGVNRKSFLEENSPGRSSLPLFMDTRVPVLAVPMGAKFTGLRNVIVSCSITDIEKEDFSFLIELQRIFEFTITVIMIVESKTSETRMEAGKTVLEHIFKNIPLKVIFQKGSSSSLIMERLIKKEYADMLVLFPGVKDFFEVIATRSKTRSLLHFLSKTSILLLPEKLKAGISSPVEYA